MDAQNHNGIRYIRFIPEYHPELLEKIVSCYQVVFGDDPWNEWVRCPTCGRHWGLSVREVLDRGELLCCNRVPLPFWPEEQVRSDILHEITQDASCWLVLDQNEVVGFSWGYPMTPEMLEKKLELRGLAATLATEFPDIKRVAYQDELGVIKDHRGRGHARQMFLSRLEDFRAQGLHVGVVRTKRTPPSVTYSWFTRIGYKTIAEYHDPDDRVVLARSFEGIKP